MDPQRQFKLGSPLLSMMLPQENDDLLFLFTCYIMLRRLDHSLFSVRFMLTHPSCHQRARVCVSSPPLGSDRQFSLLSPITSTKLPCTGQNPLMAFCNPPQSPRIIPSEGKCRSTDDKNTQRAKKKKAEGMGMWS
ncbi:uncharacterized [Tachysurus ichikawai]